MRKTVIALLAATGSLGAAAIDVPAEFKSCYGVYRSLLVSIGRYDMPPPEFTPTYDLTINAKVLQNGKMLIGSKLIDVCRSLGSDSLNAMALVIGHELAHYYNRHFWASQFGSAYAELAWGQRIDTTFDDLKEMGVFETQADEFGMFFAFVAGYDPFGVAERLYPLVYQEFNLSDSMKGYPPKHERVAIAQRSEDRVKRLIPVFTAGNLMLAIAMGETKKYKTFLLNRAGKCFEHVIGEGFSSREMYNNLGVCRMQEALSLMDQSEVKFIYPTVIDAESRLFSIDQPPVLGAKGDPDDAEKIRELLVDASNFFEQALKQDKEYVPAYINLACVQVLQDELVLAQANAQVALTKADETKQPLLAAYATDISGIIAAKQQDVKTAKAQFEAAAKKGSPISKTNLATMNGKELPKETTTFSADLNEEESVNGITMYELYRKLFNAPSPDMVYKLRDESRLLFTQQERGQVFDVECGERECPFDDLVMFQTGDNYDRPTTRGVKIGDALDVAYKYYGEPDRLIAFSNHTYYLFKKSGLLFKVDTQNHITGWVVFYYKSSF